VARLAALDVRNKEEADTLEAILSELPSDDGWNDECMFEKAYKKQGLKRYRMNKSLLESQSVTVKDTETITCGKDMGKAATKAICENGEARHEPDKAFIKLEHMYIRPAGDALVSMNSKYKRMHSYIQEYKGLYAMLHLKATSPEKADVEKQISESLAIWALLEAEVLTNRFQLAPHSVQKLHFAKCQALVNAAGDLNVRVQSAIDGATESKKRLNKWMHDHNSDIVE
jgi:hypothetical protein